MLVRSIVKRLCDMEEAQIQQFFNDYKAFEEKREAQKSRGLNDYNLMTALLPARDETRLHTGFLYSLLNPDGKHYQGALFLELFINRIGLPQAIDLNSATVHKEFQADGLKGSIDLVITDGDTWIIIENKLNANDQPTQAQRYIEYCVDEEKVEPDNLYFVYLSISREKPGKGSLGTLSICENNKKITRSKDIVCSYISIHYRQHILNWLGDCKKEVENITNLAFAIGEYEEVIQRVYKEYRSRVMGIESFIRDQSGRRPINKERYRAAINISKDIHKMHAEVLKKFMSDAQEFLSKDEFELQTLTSAECENLENREYSDENADKFFTHEGNKSNKNKGLFWSTGSSKGHYAVAVLFGSKWIHVGLIPLENGSNKAFRFSDNQDRAKGLINDIRGHKAGFSIGGSSFKKHDPINGPFPGLVSFGKPIEDEIVDFTEFDTSRQAEALRFILDFLGK